MSIRKLHVSNFIDGLEFKNGFFSCKGIEGRGYIGKWIPFSKVVWC